MLSASKRADASNSFSAHTLKCVFTIFLGCTGGSEVQIRQIQTGEYDTLNKRDTFRLTNSTLQGLGFVIDKADDELAAVTATKLQNYQIRMTVTVRERDGERLAVRANARFNENLVADAAAYQNFFAALDKAMFLTLHEID